MHTSITIGELCVCVLETFSHSDVKGDLQRLSGDRHSLSHSFDFLSLDTVHHFPSTHRVALDWLSERVVLDDSIRFPIS